MTTADEPTIMIMMMDDLFLCDVLSEDYTRHFHERNERNKTLFKQNIQHQSPPTCKHRFDDIQHPEVMANTVTFRLFSL